MTPEPTEAGDQGGDNEGGTPQLDATMEAAHASLEDEAARQLFMAGRALYEAGRFAEAAAQWRQAYELSGRAPLLYNVYVASRDAGLTEESAVALRRYLEENPDAPERPRLEARLRALETQLSERAEREEAVRQAQAEAEDARAAVVSPIPWIVTSIGGALLVSGVITGLVANGAVSTLEENCPGDVCPSSYTDFQSDFDSAETLVTLTDVLLLSGIAVTSAGLTWGLIDLLSGGDGEAQTASLLPACGATGCTATLSLALGGSSVSGHTAQSNTAQFKGGDLL